jgi:carbonic anhydrase
MKIRNFRAVFFAVLIIGITTQTGPVFAGEGTEPTTAEDALAWLKEGNARFAAMKMEHPDANNARREETAVNGQKPFAVVLGCADSRVPVEMVFDQGIGDIFTVRVAGNIAVDSSVVGSLEYAAGHLHVPLLVILGHTQCGAVGAAISGEKLEGSLHDIQEQILPVVKEVKLENPNLKDPALTHEVIKQNVFQVERDLRANSEEIRDLAAQGALKIVLAIYDVKTGKVDWFEEK